MTLADRLVHAQVVDRAEVGPLIAAAGALAAGDGEEALARMWWSLLTEPGDATAARLIAEHGANAALSFAVDDHFDVSSVSGDPVDVERGRRRWRSRVPGQRLRQAIRSAQSLGVRVVVPSSPFWPRRLDDLGDHAPVCLWCRGDPSIIDQARSVAIVGARAASAYGVEATADLAEGLAGRGFTVVSGGAYGIDRQAHLTALRRGASTVGVLAGGVDRLYPAGNESLLRDISARGCLMAEQPPGTMPSRWRFLARNRLIAALAGAVVVVEAGARSGALNTAHHAAQIGRPLGAVPGAIFSSSSVGANRLIRDGIARLVASPDDVLSLLSGYEVLGEVDAAVVDGLRAELVRVHDALDLQTVRDLDALARISGLDPAEVSLALDELDLLQLAQPVDSGRTRWRKAPQR